MTAATAPSMSAAQRSAAIEARLRASLAPTSLAIRDDSALHHGHVGAQGGGHFHVQISAACFAGLSTLARHRLVYDAVAELMHTEIHALSIEARVDAPGAKD